MRIAVNAIPVAIDRQSGAGYYTLELFRRVAVANPGDDFLFLSDRPLENLDLSNNIFASIIGKPAAGFSSRRWWFDMSLPKALRKWRADVFVSLDGYCSLTARLPQTLGIYDLSPLHRAGTMSPSRTVFQRMLLPQMLKKARAIVTPSQVVKQDIIGKYKVPGDQVTVIHEAAKDSFHPVEWEAKQEVKDGYADGREFFLFRTNPGSLANLLTVLKAFSQFKMWQHSNMKLVVAGDLYDDGIAEKIRTYKFRDDVVLMNNVTSPQMETLLASAYAVLCPSLHQPSGIMLLEAMRSGTAVIATDIPAFRETGGDAVLYVEPSQESISAQMIRLYKDEELRAQLVKAGQVRQSQFTWNGSAETLWEVIQRLA
jgi:glycosyltransferase involved in cell wall biosynthesis